MITVPLVGNAASPESAGGGGGEIIDGGTFVGGPPEHIDPALNTTLDAYQVINMLYDGLTELDLSDPENVQVVPLVAESFESNEDATVWTFTIKEGMAFSNGEEILPSTFQRSWERAADVAGNYNYLLNFIDGGAERLAGEADTISGIAADDAAMTLTVTMDAPYANFPAVAGFQTFFPMPEEAVAAGDQYENELMIGNGPYMMESARTDEEIVLVPSESWAGDLNGETWPDRPERLEFRIFADPDTSYNALEAGETDIADIPPARAAEAQSNWGTTVDVEVNGAYFFQINQSDPRIGGPENLDLRKAISLAIDRDAINESVYNGLRTVSTGITPPGIPGFAENLCEYCAYDPEGAQAAYDAWLEAGNEPQTIPIQFNADAGHEPVVTIIIDNLSAIGIEAEPDPRISETYFSEMADGGCVLCRSGWIMDYPTYDNFMWNLFHTDSLGGTNYGYQSSEFDGLVDEAMSTPDPEAAAPLYQQSEQFLLNDEVGVIPINWYLGTYAFNPENLEGFGHGSDFLIPYHEVTVTK